MEKFATIDKARRLLAAEMYTGVIVALAIVLLYENEILLPGSFSDCVNGEFITVSAMEVLTICMLPLALGTGEGSETWQPMGIAVIGGLTFSTLLTLLVVPVLYSVFVNRRIRKTLPGQAEPLV